MDLMKGLKAIANPTRLRILELLTDPEAIAESSIAGQPPGVNGTALLGRLRCAQPTLNEHMQILGAVGLVESRKVGRWVIYTRDEERIRQFRQTIIDQLLPPR